MRATGVLAALLLVSLLNFDPCLFAQDSGEPNYDAAHAHGSKCRRAANVRSPV
jgi:hypothetical protein